MKCYRCNNEMFVDHVKPMEDGDKYIYVCMNPSCTAYRKAITATGEPAENKITEKQEG